MSATPPHPNWRLIARRQLQADGKVFPCGAEVPVAALGRNFQQLIDSGGVRWVPPDTGIKVHARDLVPTPAAPTAPKAIEIVQHSDPVMAWRLTREARAQQLGGDYAKATDQLLANPQARDLYQIATRTAVANERKRRGNGVNAISITPDTIRGL
jgi:hypothetical protein